MKKIYCVQFQQINKEKSKLSELGIWGRKSEECHDNMSCHWDKELSSRER